MAIHNTLLNPIRFDDVRQFHQIDEPDYGKYGVNLKEYAIGGKLITVTHHVHVKGLQFDINDTKAKATIKNDLAKYMSAFIIENNLAEFTVFTDPITLNKIVNMRCYLAPDDQVKILRIYDANTK